MIIRDAIAIADEPIPARPRSVGHNFTIRTNTIFERLNKRFIVTAVSRLEAVVEVAWTKDR